MKSLSTLFALGAALTAPGATSAYFDEALNIIEASERYKEKLAKAQARYDKWQASRRPDKVAAVNAGLTQVQRRYAARHGVTVEEIVQTHKRYPVGMLDHWADRTTAEAADHRFERMLDLG